MSGELVEGSDELRYWTPTTALEVHDGAVYRLYVEHGTHEYGERWARTSRRWVEDDGGREAAGFRGLANDCVTRAVAIALRELHGAHDDAGEIYRDVYDDVAARCRAAGRPKSGRNPVPKRVVRELMAARGFDWHATMSIGSGCRVHLDAGELPAGIIVASVSKHVVAVVDGIVRDTHDSTRGGSRCVYGYWTLVDAEGHDFIPSAADCLTCNVCATRWRDHPKSQPTEGDDK